MGLIIFGGTFDPIHNGHLQLAHNLSQTFNSKIIFLPVYNPSHKELPQASPEKRIDMLKLAIGNNPNFIINPLEINMKRSTYTYNTLSLIRTHVGDKETIFFIIGADSFVNFDSWHNWEELLKLSNFIVVKRHGHHLDKIKEDLANKIVLRPLDELGKTDLENRGKFYLFDFTPLDVSSTYIRTQIQTKQDVSNFMPEVVYNYIKKNNLYDR